ncbi:MAG: ATP-binding protein [Bacteroidales bacterium]|nr:ATP-binding protein [Bacteroidales bacterium]
MKLEIKNFGPIKEGKIETKKVTVLIGNQGSGKSTVAKLLATFAWIEKDISAINGEISNEKNEIGANFIRLLKYYSIENYRILDSTILNYIGAVCNIQMSYKTESRVPRHYSNQFTVDYANGNYLLPRITYFPAERNIVSSLKIIKEGLFSQSLQDFNELFQESKINLNGEIQLPIGNSSVGYNGNDLYVNGENYSINLSESASGFQSFVPMFLVVDYLSTLQDKKEMDNKNRVLFKKQSAEILNNPLLSVEQQVMLLSNIAGKLNTKRMINIIEEPEQNLFPLSQRNVLNSLLEFNNAGDGNELILTTHSPYILSYLMLAIKAAELRDKANGNEKVLSEIYKIVPEKAITPMKDVVIYELNDDGTISELKQVYGLPSNDNFLSNELGEVNTLFSELMEIEDLCHE